MAIKIFSDKIQFNNYSLEFTPTGIGVNSVDNAFFQKGTFSAASFNDISPMEGTVAGFISGGQYPFNSNIQRFPFASDTNTTLFNNLPVVKFYNSGQSSTTHGYTEGSGSSTSNIDKFSFASAAPVVNIGALSRHKGKMAGQSSATHGYFSGGAANSPPLGNLNVIERFPFATDTTASDVGDLTSINQEAIGHSSSVKGYNSGGLSPGINTIQSFPFASASTNAVNVGNLTTPYRASAAGQSSREHGYTSGGDDSLAPPGAPPDRPSNVIDRFSFASEGAAADVGDLSIPRNRVAGASSTTSGYTGAGYSSGPPGAPISLTLDKFPFASTTNASLVGSTLAGSYARGAGHQD